MRLPDLLQQDRICIPSLEDVLATVPKGKRLFIEVKCGEQFIAAAAASLQNRPGKQIVVIGFSLPTMQKVKAAFPELEVCSIVEFKRSLRTARWSPRPSDVIAQAKAAGLDGIDAGAKVTFAWLHAAPGCLHGAR